MKPKKVLEPAKPLCEVSTVLIVDIAGTHLELTEAEARELHEKITIALHI